MLMVLKEIMVMLLHCIGAGKILLYTVRGAGDQCYQFRINTCTVFISESIVFPLITPVTGARRRQQSLPAECGQLHCPGPSSNPGRGKCNFYWVAD